MGFKTSLQMVVNIAHDFHYVTYIICIRLYASIRVMLLAILFYYFIFNNILFYFYTCYIDPFGLSCGVFSV